MNHEPPIKSLAETLGIVTDAAPVATAPTAPAAAPSAPAALVATPAPVVDALAAPPPTSVKAFCEQILHSREFRSYLLNGITLGDLPAAVMCKIMDHGWGKPADTVNVTVTAEDLSTLSKEDLALRTAKMLDAIKEMQAIEDAIAANDGDALAALVASPTVM